MTRRAQPPTEGITPLEAAPRLPLVLEAISGPAAGTSIPLQGTIRVGSGEGVEWQLDDPAVSRLHATFEPTQAGVRVWDLGSRNGTRYLGANIQEANVPIGGAVVVGRTTLRIRPAELSVEESPREELHGLLGRSLPMRQLFALLERYGPTEIPVLVQGETGVGKEPVARALHALSPRAQKPFVVLDCGAVAPALVERELFGHAKGAFSGAHRATPGLFETADGGTLFLDEVGELPLELQPKLLRVFESLELRRLGETQVRKVDVRLISATHRDLAQRAREGDFRMDFFYRLAVAVVRVPALRERMEDIPLLASHFVRQASGVDVKLNPSTLAALQCDPWPGNVRELRNAVQRAVALGGAEGKVSIQEPTGRTYHQAREELLDQFERDYLESLVARHEGNLSAAARAAGLSRPYLYKMLKRHGIGEP